MKILTKIIVLKNKWQILTLINSVLLVGLICFGLFKFLGASQNIVYVDNVKLFDGFRMTKEMKAIGEKEFSTKKNELDTLYSKLQGNLEQNAKESLMKEFIEKREAFDQFNETFALEESDKIWSRINSYTKEFSKEKDYKIIIGSDSKRDVLFADETLDVTKELTNYLNKKYAGL